MQRSAALTALALLVSLAACSGERRPSRLIVLGLDGLDPEVVETLIAEGKAPNLARLVRGGSSGVMHSPPPLLSPVIWTTIATGRRPTRHGIGHFTTVDPLTGAEQPVTSSLRRVKALWNIFSDHQKKVAVVGWWATWPAEEVNGVMVSDHTCYHFLMAEKAAGGLSQDVIWPPDAAASLAPLVRRPEDLAWEELAGFVEVPRADFEQPFRFDDDLSHLKWALATAGTYRDIGLELWRSERPDLLMVYVEAVDSASHLFGHLFRQQPLAGEFAEQQRRYGRAVEAVYRLADEIVGEFIAAMDDDTTLVVLSDHGFQLGELPADPAKTRDMRRVSEAYHREQASLLLYGKDVRPGASWEQARTLDVAPTLLALAGLPVADDMSGRVLRDALVLAAAPARVASYESSGAAGAEATSERSAGVDQAVLERLRSLGYLGSGDAPTTNDRNLAALLLREGEHRQAARAFRQLIAAEPGDAALHTGLAAALAELGRDGEAFAELGRALELDPLFVPALHNRGLLRERRGDRQAAIADYRLALRRQSDYRPSRQALARLGVPAIERVAASAAEERAARLLQEARGEARRGDYEAAEALLDEAERLVPGDPVILQYRSNLAYLRGDLETAVRILEQALRLDPDNALWRENLRRLEQRLPGRSHEPPG